MYLLCLDTMLVISIKLVDTCNISTIGKGAVYGHLEVTINFCCTKDPRRYTACTLR